MSLNTKNLISMTLAFLFLLTGKQILADQKALEKIHQRIENKYPVVNHVSGADFEKYLSETDDVVVFDVREPSEYRVSHLEGAILVDPDISRKKFIELYGDILSGKTAVLYCSVGRRSSSLADRVFDDLMEKGSKDVINLKHGIFGWHNEQRALVNIADNTDYVHPYSRRWGKLIERKELIRYSPE